MTQPRFATITLNASIDTASEIPRLIPGEINRLTRARSAAGGKGNNVARVLARLGHPVIATGFAGGYAGAFIADSLRASGVMPDFFQVAGESRTCLTVLEEGSGRVTEVREPGEPVSAADGEAFLAKVVVLVGSAERVAISGSLPPGLDANYYHRLVSVLRAAGKTVVLDTSGEPLRQVATGDVTIAPNREELADLVGRSRDDAAAITSARALVRERLTPGGCLLLTLGAGGAAYIDADRVFRARPPKAEKIANPVGAGDAFLAGWLAGGDDTAAALRFAVAVGTAAAMQAGIGEIDPADVARIVPAVELN